MQAGRTRDAKADSGAVVRDMDGRIIQWSRRHSMLVLRVSLAVVFVWFGALKLVGWSPVADLVGDVLSFLPGQSGVVVMGLIEVTIGVGLLTGWATRITLAGFFALVLGTFLILVLEPGVAFTDGNPLRLSMAGEFVVKNFVLVAAGLAIVGALPPPSGQESVGHLLKDKADQGQRPPR